VGGSNRVLLRNALSEDAVPITNFHGPTDWGNTCRVYGADRAVSVAIPRSLPTVQVMLEASAKPPLRYPHADVGRATLVATARACDQAERHSARVSPKGKRLGECERWDGSNSITPASRRRDLFRYGLSVQHHGDCGTAACFDYGA